VMMACGRCRSCPSGSRSTPPPAPIRQLRPRAAQRVPSPVRRAVRPRLCRRAGIARQTAGPHAGRPAEIPRRVPDGLPGLQGQRRAGQRRAAGWTTPTRRARWRYGTTWGRCWRRTSRPWRASCRSPTTSRG
jgi:hypothetical protein